MKTLIAIGTALCMALAMSAAHNLDTELETEQQARQQSEKQQAQQARFNRAAQALCGGENSAWNLEGIAWSLEGINLTCLTKRGFVTKKVSIQ